MTPRSWLARLGDTVAVLALAVLVSCLSACGGAGKVTAGGRGAAAHSASPSSASAAAPTLADASPKLRGLRGDEDDDDLGVARLEDSSKDNDADADNDTIHQTGYYDSDDTRVLRFGGPASATQEAALKAIATRYYAAAAAGDGRAACALTQPLYAQAIPEVYGRPPGPRYARGKTCAQVLSRVFEHIHQELRGVIVVTGVRVGGDKALVLIGSRTMDAHYLQLQREAKEWRVVGQLGTAIP